MGEVPVVRQTTTITWDSIPDFPLGETPEDLDWNLYRLVIFKRALKAGYEEPHSREAFVSFLADARWACRELGLPWFDMLDEADILFLHQVLGNTA